ncbi:trypsin-like cysteine/serine peptidase domain-containing protein [Pelagophyceae sp. CCMP2097]|nr:trypsin-like cysteine/serine peptidase domain-containing protein [Pelagophyceae sp. CCMP2097]
MVSRVYCAAVLCTGALSLDVSPRLVAPRRRQWLQAGFGAAAAAVGVPLPSSGVILGTEATQAEAAAAGAVALWIDLAGCEVCRHDVPAACSGTLIGPNLVLSAGHCIDVPEALNGKLTKVIFGPDMFDGKAQSVEVERYLRPRDIGMATSTEGVRNTARADLSNDIVLIKLKNNAPKEWRRASMRLPDQESTGFGKDASNPLYPRATLFGFGDSREDEDDYTSGRLRKLQVAAISPVLENRPSFYTMVTAKGSGSCSGDSGGAAVDAQGDVLGILSANSLPCADSNGIFVNPFFFRKFIEKAAKEMGAAPPQFLVTESPTNLTPS